MTREDRAYIDAVTRYPDETEGRSRKDAIRIAHDLDQDAESESDPTPPRPREPTPPKAKGRGDIAREVAAERTNRKPMVGNLGGDPQASESEQGTRRSERSVSRPKRSIDPLSNESIAKQIGVDPDSLLRAREHIEAVDTFPDLADLPTKTAIREFRERTGKAKPKGSVMAYAERETVAKGIVGAKVSGRQHARNVRLRRLRRVQGYAFSLERAR